MRTCRGIGTLAAACTCVALSLVLTGTASGGSWGGGPVIGDLHLFCADTALVRGFGYVSGCGDDDDDLLGYRVELWGVPEGMYVSLDPTTEVVYRQVIDPPVPDGSRGWMLTVYAGRLDGAVLPTTVRAHCTGLFSSEGESGISFLSAINIDFHLYADLVPELPATVWSFTNTSEYDIEDGILLLNVPDGLVHGPQELYPFRFLGPFAIPSHGTLTVSGQMAPGQQWSFGGMLATDEPSAVYAFGTAGSSPDGVPYEDVFGLVYPTCGMEAARYAWWAQYLHGTGELRTDWYETYFAAPISSPVAFDLYTFSNGVQVGEGSAGPLGATIPEPATVTLLACGAGAVLLGRVRRRIRDK